MERKELRTGYLYKNLKTGHYYQLLRVAVHTEDDEDYAVYERHSPPDPDRRTYVRPLEGEAGFLNKFTRPSEEEDRRVFHNPSDVDWDARRDDPALAERQTEQWTSDGWRCFDCGLDRQGHGEKVRRYGRCYFGG